MRNSCILKQWRCRVGENVDVSRGAGSPAIKPNKDLNEDGTPITDTPKNPRL